MGNGVALIDEGWIKHSRPGILAAMPVRIAPPEELIWHRLFISERHRHDVADILHLILCLGDTFDWERLVRPRRSALAAAARPAADVQLRLSGLPQQRARRGSTTSCSSARRSESAQDDAEMDFTRGPLISRFSFTIDVREWGFSDPRAELVREARNRPEVRAIAEADVWDERGEEGSGGSTIEPREPGNPLNP